jgi:Type I restriction-modification system methyltransferase subunit
MSTKKITLNDQEKMLLKEVDFWQDKSRGAYALIHRQLTREEYETIERLLSAMHGRWVRARKRFEFAVGYDPAKMMAEVDTQGWILIEKDGFYPTPEEVVDRMIAAADLKPGLSILEPSAGTGAIAQGLVKAGISAGSIDVIEINPERQAVLVAAGFHFIGADFSTQTFTQKYDRILMNPPFENAQDAKHILKAVQLLAPGGILVAITSGGYYFRDDACYQKLRALGGFCEELPKNAFAASGTSVDTCLLVYRRSEEATDEDITAFEPASVEDEFALPEEQQTPAEILTELAQGELEFMRCINSLAGELNLPPFYPALSASAPQKARRPRQTKTGLVFTQPTLF